MQCYGRGRIGQTLLPAQPEEVRIPNEGTARRVMEQIGLSHRQKRRANGITKADREARKLDDLLKRDFQADKPLEKCVTDITEIKAADGKLYVSAIFDCFDLRLREVCRHGCSLEKGIAVNLLPKRLRVSL